MSWQKIFNTARRFGTPVIVTDQNGAEPMVILPFDIYEGLINETSSTEDNLRKTKNKISNNRMVEPDIQVESAFELPYEDVSEAKNALIEPNNQKNLSVEPNQANDLDINSMEADISLEERFYFEPVEDDLKK